MHSEGWKRPRGQCPTGVCKRKTCRYWVSVEECGNCCLHVKREYSFREIGRVLGVSGQRVEQIQKRALRKVEKKMRGLVERRMQWV
jgi:hypothetical protein